MRFYEKEDKRYKKLNNRTMSASDPIQHHKQLDDTRSKTDKDVDSPDNDSVFGDSVGSAAEDVFNPPASVRRINMSNFSSPGSPKVFAASRYETSRIMTSSSVREHRFSSSSSSSSLREELTLLGRSQRGFTTSTSIGTRMNLFQRRNLRHRGIMSPLR